MQALVKLSGPNRRVWFLSEDGETITAIRDNQQFFKLAGYGGQADYSTDISINLENGRIYNIPNDKLESIALDSDTNYICCALHFTTGNTAPTFTMPNNWVAIGADVIASKFIPVANSEYNIAIDTEEGTVTLYIAASRCSDKVADIKNRVLNGDILDWNDEED